MTISSSKTGWRTTNPALHTRLRTRPTIFSLDLGFVYGAGGGSSVVGLSLLSRAACGNKYRQVRIFPTLLTVPGVNIIQTISGTTYLEDGCTSLVKRQCFPLCGRSQIRRLARTRRWVRLRRCFTPCRRRGSPISSRSRMGSTCTERSSISRVASVETAADLAQPLGKHDDVPERVVPRQFDALGTTQPSGTDSLARHRSRAGQCYRPGARPMARTSLRP